jgi:metallo-beta-lactamase family protein
VLQATVRRGGSVLVPVFAVDRTEVNLYQLSQLATAGLLPHGMSIHVDSPMALRHHLGIRHGVRWTCRPPPRPPAPDARNSVPLVGFQAAGTRGRSLLEGTTELKLLGQYVRVRAEFVDLPAFTVHADASELPAWTSTAPSEPRDRL